MSCKMPYCTARHWCSQRADLAQAVQAGGKQKTKKISLPIKSGRYCRHFLCLYERERRQKNKILPLAKPNSLRLFNKKKYGNKPVQNAIKPNGKGFGKKQKQREGRGKKLSTNIQQLFHVEHSTSGSKNLIWCFFLFHRYAILSSTRCRSKMNEVVKISGIAG